MEVRGVLETGERNDDSHRSDATGRHSPECRASPSGTQQPDRFSDSVRFPADPPEGDAKVEALVLESIALVLLSTRGAVAQAIQEAAHRAFYTSVRVQTISSQEPQRIHDETAMIVGIRRAWWSSSRDTWEAYLAPLRSRRASLATPHHHRGGEQVG